VAGCMCPSPLSDALLGHPVLFIHFETAAPREWFSSAGVAHPTLIFQDEIAPTGRLWAAEGRRGGQSSCWAHDAARTARRARSF
jgi:hypothetical protein